MKTDIVTAINNAVITQKYATETIEAQSKLIKELRVEVDTLTKDKLELLHANRALNEYIDVLELPPEAYRNDDYTIDEVC